MINTQLNNQVNYSRNRKRQKMSSCSLVIGVILLSLAGDYLWCQALAEVHNNRVVNNEPQWVRNHRNHKTHEKQANRTRAANNSTKIVTCKANVDIESEIAKPEVPGVCLAPWSCANAFDSRSSIATQCGQNSVCCVANEKESSWSYRATNQVDRRHSNDKSLDHSMLDAQDDDDDDEERDDEHLESKNSNSEEDSDNNSNVLSMNEQEIENHLFGPARASTARGLSPPDDLKATSGGEGQQHNEISGAQHEHEKSEKHSSWSGELPARTLRVLNKVLSKVIAEKMGPIYKQLRDEQPKVGKQSNKRSSPPTQQSTGVTLDDEPLAPESETDRQLHHEALLRAVTGTLAGRAIATSAWRPKLMEFGSNVAQLICQSNNTIDKCHESSSIIQYRTFDGSCNNLNHNQWGRARTGYARLLPVTYDDGLNSPRTLSVRSQRPLPGARKVSATTFGQVDAQTRAFNTLGAFLGQFVAHDLSKAAPDGPSPAPPFDCCKLAAQKTTNGQKNSIELPAACFAIPVDALDSFYGWSGVRCLNMVRTEMAPPAQCELQAREQMNHVSQWLDASTVYGNSEREARKLRSFTGGRLLERPLDGASMMPGRPFNAPGCALSTSNLNRNSNPMTSESAKCLAGGDSRLNQTPYLAMTHVIFFRLHNRLAELLAAQNQHWDDERLFQEARRLLIAVYQSIVMRELLPILVGQQVMRQFGLNSNLAAKIGDTEQMDESKNGGFTRVHRTVYKPDVQGHTLNEFANGAFRLHNLVWGVIQFNRDDGSLLELPSAMWKKFNSPADLYDRVRFASLVRSSIQEPSGKWDTSVPDDIHGRLFQPTTGASSVGSDLIAIDLQRSRDHGIATYNQVRDACGLETIAQFEQLKSIVMGDSWQRLASLYEHPDDIDLYIGGQLERPLEGATVGPTFACLIAEQFRRMRDADRFFYTHQQHDDHESGATFTDQQVARVHQMSMASVLCGTVGLKSVQPFALLVQSSRNQRLECSKLNLPTLDEWRESTGENAIDLIESSDTLQL